MNRSWTALRTLACPLLVAAALMAAPTRTAQAASGTVVILGLDAADGPSSSVAQELTSQLRQQARRAGVKVQNRKDSLAEIKLNFGCMTETAACMSQVGKTLGTERLLFGSVRRAPGGYNVSLKLVTVSPPTIDKFVTELLPEGQSRGSALEGRATHFVAALLGVGKGGVRITVAQKGAQVSVDGAPVGVSGAGPITTDLPAGVHTINVTHEGFAPYEQRVDVPVGSTVAVNVNLRPLQLTTPSQPSQPSEPASPRRGSRIAFWATASTAAVTGVLTLVFFLRRGSLQSDLGDEVRSGQAAGRLPVPARGSSDETTLNRDACQFYRSDAGVQDICNSGKTAATLSIAFGSIAAASTVVAGYFLYRGYLSGGARERSADADEPIRQGRPRSVLGSLRILPNLSTNAAGASATLQF